MSSSRQKPTIITKLPFAWIEVVVFFLAAVAIYAAQTLYTNHPLLSLLFDSQGYLWTAQAVSKAFSPESLHLLLSFITSGMPDSERATVLSHFTGLSEIVKTGPVLPAMLSAAYAVAHKSLSPSNWHAGAWLMILTSALTIVPVWFWSRKLAGVNAARIAALLTLAYSGFAVNSARLLSEIPGISFSLLALLSFVVLMLTSHDAEQRINSSTNRDERRGQKTKALFVRLILSLSCGVLVGIMMLARPTLIPIPILLLASVIISGHLVRIKSLIKPSIVAGVMIGIGLIFAPWVLCKAVLTGKPSVMVERYGPYNLCTGMDLRTDGWDALPSEYVSHPNRFTLPMSDVLKQIAREAREQPAAFLQMLIRKPCRLIDSPWNDFQVGYLGIPWLIQRLIHQIILMSASLGIVMMLGDGWKRRNQLLVTSGLVLGSFVLYHFISCIFITMGRYFVTAMPAMLVASGYFLSQVRGRKAPLILLAVLAAPVVSSYFDYLLAPGYGRVSEFKSDVGLVPSAWILSFILSITVAFSMMFPATQVFLSLRAKLAAALVTIPICFVCLVASSHQVICSEAVLRLGVIDHKMLRSTVNIPVGNDCNQWYLIFDANDISTRDPGRSFDPLLAGLDLSLNGRKLQPDWQPLLVMDSARREEVIYLSAFAYSAGKRPEDFRQWIACPLPRESIKEGSENVIEISLKSEDDKHPKIFADFADDNGARIHSVSRTEFSWSKGFFAGLPGEMRLDEFASQMPRKDSTNAPLRVAGVASELKARIFLLGTTKRNLIAYEGENPIVLNAPDRLIGMHEKELFSTWETLVPQELFGNAQVDDLASQSVRVKVSGEIRSNNTKADGAVVLIENYNAANGQNYSEFAPLAPQKIPANRTWSKFQFEDFIKPEHEMLTSNGGATGIAGKLSSLKLSFAGRPWWECLAYGLFKPKSTIAFRNVKVELSLIPSMDLNQDAPQWFELESEFQREKN